MINHGYVMGNLTRDPESKGEVALFSIAVNKEGAEKKVYYFDCVTFKKSAEFVLNYMKKGSRVLVEYSLEQSRWADKETGKGREKVKLICNKVTSLDKKSDQSEHSDMKADPSDFVEVVSADEIPFS